MSYKSCSILMWCYCFYVLETVMEGLNLMVPLRFRSLSLEIHLVQTAFFKYKEDDDKV